MAYFNLDKLKLYEQFNSQLFLSVAMDKSIDTKEIIIWQINNRTLKLIRIVN